MDIHTYTYHKQVILRKVGKWTDFKIEDRSLSFQGSVTWRVEKDVDLG